MRKHKLTLKVFLLILSIDFLESIGELFMKKGLGDAGIVSVNLHNLGEMILKGTSSYYIWAGILIYMVDFLILLAVLSRVQLSVAFPAGSTSYIYVTIFAIIFLHEKVDIMRWAGIALIIMGINFVSRSTQMQE